MYYVKHYDENGDLFQIANIDSNKNLELFKDTQVSNGEFALIYCYITDDLVEDFSKE